MNKIIKFTLKSLRKLYTLFKKNDINTLQREENPEKVAEIIYKLLISDKPCMIARFGAFELATIVNYLGIQNKEHSVIKYIKGEQQQWWWNKKLMMYMQNNAGFFPTTEKMLSLFCKNMLKDAQEVDLLGSWQNNEIYLKKQLRHAKFVQLELLNPFWSKQPWSKALNGKKVLVVHPFTQSIQKQYSIREKLFSNPDILPNFELKTIKAVQSIGGGNDNFNNWFEALNWMKSEMDKIDYDICLIGCGAYGFPLAAHAKRMGKKSVHLGGSLQLLFGIKGARWETPSYNSKYKYSTIMNEYWIRPSDSEKPDNAKEVENACYW